MKTQKLLLTLIFLLAGILTYAQGVLTLTGQISPVNGPINVNLTYVDNGTTVNSTFMTDVTGFFLLDSIYVMSNQGYTEITFNDCNGNLMGDSGMYFLTPANGLYYDFGTINYCSNSTNQTFITGAFANAQSAINYSLSLDFGATYQNFTSDPNGIFMADFPGLTGQGVVFLQFTDCYGNTHLDSAFNSSSSATQEVFNFNNLDYCPTSSITYINIAGYFNSASAVTFTLTYGNQNISGTSNNFGFFNFDSIQVSNLPNFVVITFIDCNGNTSTETAFLSGSSNPADFNFAVIDYCPTSSSNTFFNIQGSFNPANTPVSFTITYGTNQSISGTTDSQGNFFFDSVMVATVPNFVEISFTDCNGNVVSDTAMSPIILPFPAVFDFGIIDYCTNVNPTLCNAGFTLNQNVVIDSFGVIISVGNVMVINTSTGQNLNYTWDFGDGSPTYTGVNFLHTYAANGPYLLCLTVANSANCVNTFCDSVMVNANGVLSGKTNTGFSIQMGDGSDNTNNPSEISTFANAVYLNIFPNPASETVNITFESTYTENMNVNIYNITGKLVLSNTINVSSGKNNAALNIENLEKGVYIIQLKSNLGFMTKTLSVK